MDGAEHMKKVLFTVGVTILANYLLRPRKQGYGTVGEVENVLWNGTPEQYQIIQAAQSAAMNLYIP